jgi:hypothetical protein
MHAYEMSYKYQSTTPPTQLPHTFSYIVAILIHNHFESPNICLGLWTDYRANVNVRI